MFHRAAAALIVVLAFTGVLLAGETRGRITKIEDDSSTIRTLGVRFDATKGKSIGEPEEKKFKIGKDVKIICVIAKGTEDAKMTLDDLKAAVKASKRVTVRITHEGENCSIITVLPPGLGGGESDQ